MTGSESDERLGLSICYPNRVPGLYQGTPAPTSLPSPSQCLYHLSLKHFVLFTIQESHILP